MEIEDKLNGLRDYIHGKKIVVAFSGGADSTLLALIAAEESEEAVAVTVDNGLMPSDCIQKSESIAKQLKIKHQVLRMNFLEDPEFAKNPENRCYICRNKIYQHLLKIAADLNYDHVVDGTNIDDLMEDRPGIMVNLEKNIKMPLVKYGFTSDDVRTILKNHNVSYNPSTTCYATRIPTGSLITTKKINRISYAENLIRTLTGLNVVRVRDEDGSALIQVENVTKLVDNALLNHINSELRTVGFISVNLDIGDYGAGKKELMIYKPCKDEANKIMFETELPYQFDMGGTCHELNAIGKVKCSLEMGIAMVEIDESNITLFEKGKIVARKVSDQKAAQELLIRVLPAIRRKK